MKLLWSLAVVALTIAGLPVRALACSPAPEPVRPFVIQSSGVQALAAPPPAPISVVATVEHARGSEPSDPLGCGGAPKCGGDPTYDAVLLSVQLPEGVERDGLGYRIRVVRGVVPPQLEIEGDFAAASWGDLVFYDAGIEPLDFTLALSTLDRVGNESAAVEVTIRDDGGPPWEEDEGGCSAAGSAGAPWLLALGALIVVRSRRGSRGLS